MAQPPSAATLLAGLGHYTADGTGSLVPPLHLGVTALGGAPPGMAGHYARSGNPTTATVEEMLVRLEGGSHAAAFTAGAAAAQAVLATLRPGDHVVMEGEGYYEFRAIAEAFCARWGVALNLVDMADPGAVAAALRPGQTRLIWAEMPTNPLWRVPDLPALAGLARGAGARLLVDATVATPLLLPALGLGADWVLHSATKYLNGHGDVTGGALVAARRDDTWDEVLEHRTAAGTVLSPFSAWLVLRGMRTMALRVERASRTAQLLAEWLSGHPAVAAVHYPGLAGHPQERAARAQFRGGFGGMLSFQLRAGEAEALRVCERARVFRRSTSLGSTESLIEHRRSTEGAASRCPADLLRLSIGIEDAGELRDDLAEALGG